MPSDSNMDAQNKIPSDCYVLVLCSFFYLYVLLMLFDVDSFGWKVGYSEPVHRQPSNKVNIWCKGCIGVENMMTQKAQVWKIFLLINKRMDAQT